MTLQHILQPDQKTPHDHSVFTLININTKVIFIHEIFPNLPFQQKDRTKKIINTDFTESTPLILSEQ